LDEWDLAIEEVSRGVKVVMTPGGAPLDTELPDRLKS